MPTDTPPPPATISDVMLWKPTEADVERSNIARALRDNGLSSFDELYAWSISDPEGFWGYVIESLGIRFDQQPSRVIDLPRGPTDPAWLPDARMNIAESCFQAPGHAPAIIAGSAAGGIETIQYDEVHHIAGRVASSLRRIGIVSGDAVAVYTPMTALSVSIYLGIILAGCVVVSIPDSFSAEQLGIRLRLGGAKAVFTVSSVRRGGKDLPVYARVLEADGPPAVLAETGGNCPESQRDTDHTWSEFLRLGDDTEVVPVFSCPDSPINILFSSGTTDEPKAIVWDHTTPIKSASDGFFHHDIHEGDVVAWPTSLGWMMGPWLIFATMINRGTIALYDGSPMEPQFGQFIHDSKANVLGVVPSMVRQWRDTGAMARFDWSAIHMFSSTGECSNKSDMHYLSSLAGGKPIIEYCGGTEIGGGYVTSTVVQPNIASAFSTPALGSAFVILDEEGKPARVGEVFLVPPAMGLSRRLLNRDHHQVYYADTPTGPDGEILRRHGDVMERLNDGYFCPLGRADDTMNVSGIKVGSAEIERALRQVVGVREVAAIAATPPGGGPDSLVICAALDDPDMANLDELKRKMQHAIRSALNPLFKIGDVWILKSLPRTASNKIIRRQLRRDYEDRLKKSVVPEGETA